jgi:hypothetical protein
LIVYPGKQNMVGFDMLDNFTEMTANKIPPWISWKLVCNSAAVAENNNFGLDLHFLQKPMKNYSLIEIADNNRRDKVQILAVVRNTRVALESHSIFCHFLFYLLEFRARVILVYNVHHFRWGSLRHVSAFYLTDYLAQTAGRTFGLVAYR